MDISKEIKWLLRKGYTLSLACVDHNILNILTELNDKICNIHLILERPESMEEWKPCPFCGGDPEWVAVNTLDGNKYACKICGASPGYRTSSENARKAWQHRP